MDSSRGAFGHALATGFALGIVDISEVVGHRDSLKGTCFGALAAADTGGRAVLAGHRALLLVVAGHEDATVVTALVADFEYTARTSLGTGLTADTEILVNLRQMGFRVDVDSIESASLHAVATTQTAKRTGTLASEETVGESARQG